MGQCSEMQECVKYNSKYYWVAAGNGDDLTVTEKKLKVKTSPSSFGGMGKVPVGTVITFS